MLEFTIEFPQEYPFRPPSLKCNTPVYHPNIDCDGNVWLNMLTRSQWNPKSDISDVLRSLYVLFVEPDENAKMNEVAANDHASNLSRFK